LKSLLEKDESIDKTFIFVKSKALADRLHNLLEEVFPEQFGVIHSNKSQNFRLRMVREFKEDKLRGIVATDLVSRGIDIENVSHVINFDIPEQQEQYMHRIGRTGRVDQQGFAVSFITEKEEANFSAIEDYMNHKVDISDLPADVDVSKELIPEEEERDIHDAPTILEASHSVGDGPKDTVSTKVKKKENFRPRDTANKKVRKKRKRRK
jgi:ATP-dependent RNA helicase RhlE